MNMSYANGNDFEQEDPGPPPDGRDAPSAGTRKRVETEAAVARFIDEAAKNGARILELNNKNIKTIPATLLELSQLQYLYLEGNELTSLPENFFDCLNNLRWLDLRRNYLESIPSTYIGRHKHLRSLLLESNNLKTLPLELGLISTLNGLNIANNPLEFPPDDIIERGTQAILQFFRELLAAKSGGMLPEEGIRMDQLQIQEPAESAEASGTPPDWGSHDAQLLEDYMLQQEEGQALAAGHPMVTPDPDLSGPVHQAMSLHKPRSYGEIKKSKQEKLRKIRSTGHADRQSANKQGRIVQYDGPLPPEVIEQRMLEERKLARLKEVKEKQDLILQRRKDNEVLKDFQNESRRRQRQKYIDSLHKKEKDFTDPVMQAPFGIDDKHLKLPTNQERIAQEIKETHEKMRKPLSPRSRRNLEEARAERDRELERRIKTHMLQMQERRRRPKGTPQEEMEAAKQDLKLAEKLQKDLAIRRKALEYRFQAFTGGV